MQLLLLLLLYVCKQFIYFILLGLKAMLMNCLQTCSWLCLAWNAQSLTLRHMWSTVAENTITLHNFFGIICTSFLCYRGAVQVLLNGIQSPAWISASIHHRLLNQNSSNRTSFVTSLRGVKQQQTLCSKIDSSWWTLNFCCRSAWNSLPDFVVSAPSIETFKMRQN